MTVSLVYIETRGMVTMAVRIRFKELLTDCVSVLLVACLETFLDAHRMMTATVGVAFEEFFAVCVAMLLAYRAEGCNARRALSVTVTSEC